MAQAGAPRPIEIPVGRVMMQAVEWQAPGELRLVERPLPDPSPGQAVVEVAFCGICGSDLHSFRSGFAAQPGQVLGHEFSGTVLSAPGVAGVAAGQRVAVRPLIPCGECVRCREGEPNLCEAGHASNIGYGSPGAFAERVLVPRAVLGETMFPLPDELSDQAGALVEPLSVALHAVRLAAARGGDVVLVVGAGPIGLATLGFLRDRGCRIVVSEPALLRRETARSLGAHVVVDPSAREAADAVRELTGPGAFGLGARADAVIECSGSPAGFSDAMKCVRNGGVVVLTALYAHKLEFNPDRIVEKELTLRGALAYRDEFPAVISKLAAGEIDAEALVSHCYPLSDASAAFMMQLTPAKSLKVLISPRLAGG